MHNRSNRDKLKHIGHTRAHIYIHIWYACIYAIINTCTRVYTYIYIIIIVCEPMHDKYYLDKS